MEAKKFNNIKNILLSLIVVIVLLNIYLFFGAKNSIRIFSESFFYSLENRYNQANLSNEIELSTFKLSDGKVKIINGQNPDLNEQEMTILKKNKELFDYLKLDAHLFQIKFYKLRDNEIYAGFSTQIHLSDSRLYQIYIPLILNIIFFILIFILYKQKQELEELYSKTLNTFNKKMQKLESEANVDNITGLKNKHCLEKNISSMQNPKLILIKIDEIRKISDYFSEDTLISLIKQITILFNEYAKENNLLLFKTELDVYAFIEDNDQDEQRYEELIAELMQLVKTKDISIEYNSSIISMVLTTTIGLSLEKENIIQKAYIALKRAEKDNKNFVSYSQFLMEEQSYIEELNTAKLIQSAISGDNIFTFYQPIFDSNKNITKYESLVRIINKTSEGTQIITPGMFLATSIKTKQYEIIEEFIINKVIKSLEENPNISLSVNLAGRDMKDVAKNNKIINLLRRTKVADRLVIEVLEDENIANDKKIMEFLLKARVLGCKIAIDDFGSGFSNFAYVLELMPDYIKIDGSIIKDIIDNEKSVQIVKTIVLFTKSLGIKTVAEFVSSEEIFNKCLELGVDEFQGFYLGKPSPSFSEEEIDLEYYNFKENNA